jgi:aminopeptidase-like protein
MSPADEFDVLIDSELRPGALEWGEVVLPGESPSEVLLTTHICHPSLCNDNLTGIATLVEVGRRLAARSRRWTYRLIFAPGTLGAIAWLDRHPDARQRVRAGLCVTGVGDARPLAYKRSRRGSTEIDRLAAVLLAARPGSRLLDFSPYGYDERQYCSPGYDLAFGRLSRGVHGEYPEYHTSGDDLSFVSEEQLAGAIEMVAELTEALDGNAVYRNTQPRGEPQLGRRGLFRAIGGNVDQRSVEMAYLWLLSCCDGTKDLCAVAETSGLPWGAVVAAAERLAEADLLERLDLVEQSASFSAHEVLTPK